MVIPLIQDAIPAAMLMVTQIPTFSWSWNGGVMGDCVPVVVGDLVLDSVWPMEHPLRCQSRAGVLIKCHQLLEEDPPDLVQSFLWAITLMTLLGTLVGWFWLGRLFAQRVNVETKDCTTIVGITQLPQLPFWSSLVWQSINVDCKLSYKYKDIQSKNVGNLDKLKLFRNAWKHLICLIPFLFLPGLTQMPSVFWISGAIGSMMGLTLPSTGQAFAQARVCLAEGYF
jgi:hypothetical protein